MKQRVMYMNEGLIGGIIGCVIGLAGGIIGTYFSIRNTSGPREKAFMIRVSIIMWIAGVTFIMMLLVLQTPWRFLLWVPYGVLLPLGIITTNRTLQRIREEESEGRS